MSTLLHSMRAVRVHIRGRVQGVGFRPFVYRLAQQHQLSGWVRNELGEVQIHLEGSKEAIDAFLFELPGAAPPFASQLKIHAVPVASEQLWDFRIQHSTTSGQAHVEIPPDQFACDDCLAELRDPDQHRFGYPFINCTQCGPRYTIIQSLPYDRATTTMAGFALCPDCKAEFEDPGDRRFHAQPLACPRCGPWLQWRGRGKECQRDEAFEACVDAIRRGAIVAVRGVGGYHLICDARSDRAVAELRIRKHRPHKPFAVMVGESGADRLDRARECASIDPISAETLRDPTRPIVLVQARAGALASAVAPDLAEVGLMLPYSPLHHLLLDALDRPLVATSGNRSGDPVEIEPDSAEQHLGPLVDGFLHHNRPIAHAADDSVYRRIGGEVRPLRLGRGDTPRSFNLPTPSAKPFLALGAFLKNTLALGVENRIIVSPHVGDLGSRLAMQRFEAMASDLPALYACKPEVFLIDAHPGYPNSRWARKTSTPCIAIAHHHAHASAVFGEFECNKPIFCFTWDGTGLGSDGSIWGGELFHGCPGAWQRAGSLRPFRLPGGEAAARDGWRCAASLCWEIGMPWEARNSHRTALLHDAWKDALNAPWSSSAGRLFDAAASLIGIRQSSSFEGHAAMSLEAAATTPARCDPLAVTRDSHGIWRIDWESLVPMLCDARVASGVRAATFMDRLAHAMADQLEAAETSYGKAPVGLGGGVFQNRWLTERLTDLLQQRGRTVLQPKRLPVNDGAIAFGQAIEYRAGLS